MSAVGWLCGYTVWLINGVTLRRAGLVLRWVTILWVYHFGIQPIHQGKTAWPSAVGTIFIVRLATDMVMDAVSRDSTVAVELSRVGGVNAPVGSRDLFLQFPVLLRLSY